ncbi:MAG: hypothetical protein ABS95_02575 [Verrucomicrobia bacterium SCN 57-15]|nr:MAG: hypothetical protein ABS95_02575 [Verrucomicrobia bacterium SCN 57-15]
MSSNRANGNSPGGRPWSITTRLTVLFAASGFTLLLASGVFLYWVLERQLDREDAQFLADKVYVLRAVLRDRPNDKEAVEEETNLEGAARQFNHYYARVLDGQNRVIAETPGMDQLVAVAVFPEPASLNAPPGRPVNYQTHDGKTFSLVAASAQAGVNGPPRLVQVALDASSEEAVLTTYRRSMALMLVLGLAVATLAGRTIAKRGLAPIEDITRAASGITAARLNSRVGNEEWPRELTHLAAAFDEMLARLEDSFRRLSQFCADIAHELRTPVTNFLTESQVMLSRTRSSEEYRTVLESGAEEFTRLAKMIDTLLFLARAENAQSRVEKVALDARKEVETVLEFHRVAAEESGVTLQCEGSAAICADVVLFQRAISNLLTNAVRHTPCGGRVAVTLTQASDGGSQVTVSDTGQGIAAEHLPHVFDRFYRSDPSRTQKTGGFGLGLALVKSIMTLHGGKATVSSDYGKGTIVTLSFPPGKAPAQS